MKEVLVNFTVEGHSGWMTVIIVETCGICFLHSFRGVTLLACALNVLKLGKTWQGQTRQERSQLPLPVLKCT
jgi:hypothetical protein